MITDLTAPTAETAMSSLEIAQITGKEHAHVMRDIRNTLEEAGIGESKFGSTYVDIQNKQRPCYLLPRRECDLVVSGYSVKYRLAIIDRWHELEAQNTIKVPQTLPDALRLAADLADKVQQQNQQLALAAPKVEFYDTVTESGSICSMAVAAQVASLPFGRNTLFVKLRELGVLISCGERYNLPKQEFIERGYFTVKENSFEHPTTGETLIKFTTYVTQRGIDWLIKKFGTRTAQQQ
jgi:anti-repressor protein